ncbi:MAG: glutamate--tRNA ligase [Candidatus Sumerlaeia bacterium]
MTEPKEVRTRIAPSPTGDPHIGTAYQLLFDYAFAKSRGGKCVLRIEDTDQTRSTSESEQAILDSIKWLGIPYDEGPDVGGPYGPYRQSERTEIYREHVNILLEKGRAYRCFCTPERLAELRKEQMKNKEALGYDGHCSRLGDDEIQAKLDANEPYVIRMRVPDSGECVFQDMLRGEVRIGWDNVDDQVLLKSDGFPTYHLANVVDDHLMKISHILRGEEWINSAPKHLLLYEYFGWEAPELCHLPLLRNPDKSKLSKRKNPTSIFYYRQAGVLPEALVNYLGLMGYTLPSGEEMFSLEEMVESFDVKRISLGGPIFDATKLYWLNGRYLREKQSASEILNRMREWMVNDESWLKILPLVQPRIEKLSDIIPRTAFFFTDMVEYDATELVPNKYKLPEGGEVFGLGADAEPGMITSCLLQVVLWEMEKVREWKVENLHNVFKAISEKEALKTRDLVAPFFLAITGAKQAPPLFDSMEILGKDMVCRRVRHALDQLEVARMGLSKKKTKALEKYYQQSYDLPV